MARIFICHSSDARSFAEKLDHRLRAEGFLSVLDTSFLRVGKAYDLALKREVRKCTVFLFVISPGSVDEGRYSRSELEWARQAGKPIVGIFDPNQEPVTPPDIVQARTYVRSVGDAIADAISAIDELIPWYRRRHGVVTLFGLLALLLLGLSIGGVAYARSRSDAAFQAGIHALKLGQPASPWSTWIRPKAGVGSAWRPAPPIWTSVWPSLTRKRTTARKPSGTIGRRKIVRPYPSWPRITWGGFTSLKEISLEPSIGSSRLAGSSRPGARSQKADASGRPRSSLPRATSKRLSFIFTKTSPRSSSSRTTWALQRKS